MNHLIDILELSEQEIDRLIEIAEDIIARRSNIAKHAGAKSLLRCFLSRLPARG